jgi:hypothetical protein
MAEAQLALPMVKLRVAAWRPISTTSGTQPEAERRKKPPAYTFHAPICRGQLRRRSEFTPLALFPQPMAARCRHASGTVISTAGLPARMAIPHFEK